MSITKLEEIFLQLFILASLFYIWGKYFYKYILFVCLYMYIQSYLASQGPRSQDAFYRFPNFGLSNLKSLCVCVYY